MTSRKFARALTSARRSGELALTREEVDRLMQKVDHPADRTLIALGVATGIRRSDLVAVHVSGVDVETGTLTYYESKKRRTRTVPLGGRSLAALRQWLAVRPRASAWLFPARRGSRGHLSDRAAWDVLNRALRAAGLPPRPFHALRGTAAKLAQARGWSVEQAAELLGDTVAVVQAHYSTPSHEEMRAAAQERPVW